MDSIFDDDVDAVGNEIEAYCPGPRCKADTTHTIISMYEDEVRRVQCVVCGDVHAYRKPRGEALETEAPPTAEPVVRKRLGDKPNWELAMAQFNEADLAGCRPYSIRDTYEEMDLVSHPTFDIGFVSDLLPDNKVEITFKEGRRIMVHNRGDLAPQMPGIAEMPAPRDAKKKKRSKKKKDDVGAPMVPVKKINIDEWTEKAREAANQKKAAVEALREAEPSTAGGAAAAAAAAKKKGKGEVKAAKGDVKVVKVVAKPDKSEKAAKPAKAAKPEKPVKAAKPMAKTKAPPPPPAKAKAGKGKPTAKPKGKVVVKAPAKAKAPAAKAKKVAPAKAKKAPAAKAKKAPAKGKKK